MTNILHRKNFSVCQNQFSVSKFHFSKKHSQKYSSLYFTKSCFSRRSFNSSPFKNEHFLTKNKYSNKFGKCDLNFTNYSPSTVGKSLPKKQNSEQKFGTAISFNFNSFVSKKLLIRRSKIINREIFYVEICQIKEY